MTSDTVIAAKAASVAGPRTRSAAAARREGIERLGRLTERLQNVAEELASPAKSHAERTVLRGQFNELQRRVNRLDGIVAGEGMEARGQARVASTPAAGRSAGDAEAPAAPAQQDAPAATQAARGVHAPPAQDPQVDVVA